MTEPERELFEKAARLSDRSVGKLLLHLARPGARSIIAEAEGAATNNS